LFDAANFLIVVKHISFQIDDDVKNISGASSLGEALSIPAS